jgi:hypothetical protein
VAVTTTRKSLYKPDHITDTLRDSIDWFNDNCDNLDSVVYYDVAEDIESKWSFASGVDIAAGEYINWGSTDGEEGIGIREVSGVIEVRHDGGEWTRLNRTQRLVLW